MSVKHRKSSTKKPKFQQLQQRRVVPEMELTPPNNFFDLHGDSPGPPARLYARVDNVEADNDGGLVALLDSVGADWFDERIAQAEPVQADDARGMPVTVLESNMDARSGHDDGKDFIEQGGWVEASIEFTGGPDRIYNNFFGDGREVTATFRQIDPSLKMNLEKSFSLDDAQVTTADEIRQLVSPTAALINILDVGQGNAVSIWDERLRPNLYFDLGGGVLGNAKTFPRRHAGFCFSPDTTVVLSHWDWDHWSSALRDPLIALNLNWIVPRQKLGAIHRAFAAELLQRGRLHIWPDNLKQLDQGQIRIMRCHGKDQNNSGLAMVVASSAATRLGRRVALLPGDADYASIPKISRPMRVSALMAGHHGARLPSAKQHPAPRRGGALVYSYGHGNSYGHPRLHAQLDYLVAGWKPEVTYSTTQSSRQRPCNIGVWLGRNATNHLCARCQPRFLTKL